MAAAASPAADVEAQVEVSAVGVVVRSQLPSA